MLNNKLQFMLQHLRFTKYKWLIVGGGLRYFRLLLNIIIIVSMDLQSIGAPLLLLLMLLLFMTINRAEPRVFLLTINQADYYYYARRLQVNCDLLCLLHSWDIIK